VFTHHRNFYDSIQEDIMKWLNDNWERWEEETPEFFTAQAISTVPEDMLPISVLKRMAAGVRGGKRVLLR